LGRIEPVNEITIIWWFFLEYGCCILFLKLHTPKYFMIIWIKDIVLNQSYITVIKLKLNCNIKIELQYVDLAYIKFKEIVLTFSPVFILGISHVRILSLNIKKKSKLILHVFILRLFLFFSFTSLNKLKITYFISKKNKKY
jgi:hypothetical protein